MYTIHNQIVAHRFFGIQWRIVNKYAIVDRSVRRYRNYQFRMGIENQLSSRLRCSIASLHSANLERAGISAIERVGIGVSKPGVYMMPHQARHHYQSYASSYV